MNCAGGVRVRTIPHLKKLWLCGPHNHTKTWSLTYTTALYRASTSVTLSLLNFGQIKEDTFYWSTLTWKTFYWITNCTEILAFFHSCQWKFWLKILPNSQNWKSYFFIWRWKIKKSEDMKKYICLGFLLALAFAASAEKLDDFERSKLFIVKSIFRESFFVNHFSIHSVQTWCYLWWSFCSLLQRLS